MLYCFLRLPLLFDGLPAVYNSTEYFLAKISLGMGARISLDPLIYIYPTVYSYALLFLYSVYFGFGYIFGFFAAPADFAVRFLTDPSGFYLLGRSASLVISLLTVLVLYQGVKKYIDEKSGRLAALIAGLSVNFAQFSAWATADSLLILFSALATVQILKIQKIPDIKNYLIAGAYYGLAVGAKYNAGFIIIAGLILIAQQKKMWFKKLVVMMSEAALAFLVTNPYWLLRTGDFINGIRLVSDQMYAAVSFERGVNYLWELTTLIQSELVIGVFCILAVAAALRSNLKHNIPLLAIILCTFIYVGSWQKKGLDYLFPVFPALIILTSVFLAGVFERFTGKKIWLRLIYILLFLPSLISLSYHDVLALRADTRESATDWIIHNISLNEPISYDSGHYDLGVYDIDRYISYGAGARHVPEPVKKRLEKFRQAPENKSMVQIYYLDSVYHTESTDLYLAEQQNVHRKSLERLSDEQVSYIITRGDLMNLYRELDYSEYPELIAVKIMELRSFYDELEQKFKPEVVFSPSLLTPGPQIRIYNINREKSVRD